MLQYQVVHNLSVGRRSDEVLRVLDGLQTGGLCPENWGRDEADARSGTRWAPNSIVGQYRDRRADRRRHVRPWSFALAT